MSGGELLFEAPYLDNEINGKVISWWDKEQIRTFFNYDKGKKEGTHQWFYKDGTLERSAEYKKDLQVGEMKVWYPDGSLQAIQNFSEGRMVGEHRNYYPKKFAGQSDTDRLASLFKYDENGERHGEQITYYQNGSIQATLSYHRGEMDGKRIAYDPEGSIIQETNYILGKLDGKHFEKTPDQREIVTYYKNNLKNGLHFATYPADSKGEKIKAIEATFKDDLLEGPFKEYSERGQIFAETVYAAGKKEGTSIIFSEDGTISITVEFFNDKQNGMMVEFYPKSKGDNDENLGGNFKCGPVYRETYFFDDMREGEERTYHRNGNFASIFLYENDRLSGLSQAWNEEGVLVFEAEYIDGLRHGKFRKYYDDGSPLLEQNFVSDILEGEKKKYDKEGKLSVCNYEGGNLIKTTN